MAALRGEQAGRLRIGVVSTAKYFAPSILSAFTAGYPGIEMSLAVVNREQILGLLADNEVDLALMGRPPETIPVKAFTFAPHPSVFIAQPSHALARKAAPLSALGGETFLVREQGSGTRVLMESLLEENGVIPGKIIEMASNETIKQAVMAGMGVSFISRHTVGLEVSVGRLAVLPIENTPVEREWFAVHRQGKVLLPVVEAFLQFLKERGLALVEEATRADAPRRGKNRYK